MFHTRICKYWTLGNGPLYWYFTITAETLNGHKKQINTYAKKDKSKKELLSPGTSSHSYCATKIYFPLADFFCFCFACIAFFCRDVQYQPFYQFMTCRFCLNLNFQYQFHLNVQGSLRNAEATGYIKSFAKQTKLSPKLNHRFVIFWYFENM